ncbi:hypothetical protein CQ12_40045 [Bradyrhizobium jicamae]|uniref:Uncharacterized protein n=1 Tax=Bradyrhizobium jicamae TaxID=280332 RepID=A0A0R3KHS6_9BRAD|nr:hypothetical protein [Bradyrhizobium jicamae]KRQ95329.1 hypothetical protein CQ12_40045 [Bradyrhizobium jicamae]
MNAAIDPADIPEPPPHQSIPDLVDVVDPDACAVRRAAIIAQAHATLRDPDPDPDPDPEPDEEADENDLDEDDLAADDDDAPSYTPRPPITPRQLRRAAS